MPLAKFTDIIILLDRSSSMYSIAQATRDSFNEFLKSQRAVEGEARLTLAQFSDPEDFRVTFENVPLASVPDLDGVNYLPTGWSTALYDALGRLIDDVGRRYAKVPESSRPEKVLFAIVTDGQENSSRNLVARDVAARITKQSNDYSWQFVYLGANQDAILAAKKIAIPGLQAMSYVATEAGIYNTSKSFSDKVSLLRASVPGTYTVDFNDEDRASAMSNVKVDSSSNLTPSSGKK